MEPSGRLSDEDLALPDVTLEFTEGQFDRWPQELVELIHAYGFDEEIETVARVRRYKIKITGYRWRDEVGPAVEKMRKALCE